MAYSNKIYHAKHVQSLIAKILREEHGKGLSQDRETIADVALSFAQYFRAKDDEFDAMTFLDNCSSDSKIYPLSEMWTYDNDIA